MTNFYVYVNLNSNDYAESIIKYTVNSSATESQISISYDYIKSVVINHIYINCIDGNVILQNYSNKYLTITDNGTFSE